MRAYFRRRLLHFIPLLLVISLVGFVAVRFTGDPLAIYTVRTNMSEEARQALRERLGIDKPVVVQYVLWLGAMLQGNWGRSFVTGQPVLEVILPRLGNSAILLSSVLLVTITVAIAIGIYTAVRPHSLAAYLLDAFAFLAFSTPTFWLGIMLIIIFAVKFKDWGLPHLPAGGMYDIREGQGLVSLQHLVLPTTVLSLAAIARYSRYLRANLEEVLREDYVRTARAKGLSERVVLTRHALKNAALPLVTLVLLDLPQLASFAVVTEQVFSWPGAGQLLVQHAFRSDYAVLMGLLMVTAIMVVVFNLVADIAYAYFDPRIRYA
jgi:peptide/nickel transport system permease protein